MTSILLGHPTHDPNDRLPIDERWSEIAELIRANQVVVVAGETGSGKSTKLPLICRDAGIGRKADGSGGLIGHTQPRRLAARSIATRIASLLGEEVGDQVGYAVRFNDRVGPDTAIKLVTDGLLLAEVQRDRTLSAYDAIIVDEAHERSLNIDFLLGYLKSLLPRRPDLKVIITSATIDTERFAAHFDDAPVIEITGRTFPVEIRYRPPEPDGPETPPECVAVAVQELIRTESGDILVFANGEREIHETIDELGKLSLRNTELVPLYARLTQAEQQKIFSSHSLGSMGGRRIVVSTNVAETSLTVPGIRSVVDIGTARISRYSRRTKVQRLPIEPISQASANQRAGRCGRVAPGVCIRLYAEDDYLGRPEFTEPEIQRTNLAGVILQMASLGLGAVESFPFLDPPDHRSIADGTALLEELDAVDPEHSAGSKKWLTPLGRRLSRMPVDPRLGRMVLEGEHLDCGQEIVVIAAALSIQDPRDRPPDKREAAAEAHQVFVDPRSDFLTLLNLWHHLRAMRDRLSGNQFRKQCRAQFLNVNRIREWQDVERQLRRSLSSKPAKPGRAKQEWEPVDKETADRIHQALLSGLLSQIGQKQTEKKQTDKKPPVAKPSRGRPAPVEFLGARGSAFAIAPGSVVRRTSSSWVMAAELVETNRLWARVVAPIEPRWIEELAEHLATYRYDAAVWDSARATATTIERATLFGLPIVEGRTINLRRVDRDLARELFIHHALVDPVTGDDEAPEGLRHLRFFAENRAVLAEVGEMEARARTRDLVDERKRIFEFFDERVGNDVTSVGHFNKWWKKASGDASHLLQLSVDDLVDRSALAVDDEAFPVDFQFGSVAVHISYEFDPASPVDGAIIDVPIDVLNQLDPDLLAWNVPGFRPEIYDHLLRGLPKAVRRELLPIAGSVEALGARIAERVDTSVEPLGPTVAREVRRMSGLEIADADIDVTSLPKHLRPTIRVVDADGTMIGAGKSVDTLRHRLDQQLRSSLQTAESELITDGLTAWTIGALPTEVAENTSTNTVRAFPALVDHGDTVAVRLMPNEAEQDEAMWAGTRRLLRLQIGGPLRLLDRKLSNSDKLKIAASTVQSKAGWYDDIVSASFDRLMQTGGAPVWNEDDFDVLLRHTRDGLDDTLTLAAEGGIEIARAAAEAADALDRHDSTAAIAAAVADERSHLSRLVYAEVVSGVGLERLGDIARYLRAIPVRLAAAVENPRRDRDHQGDVRAVESAFAELVQRNGMTPDLEDLAWAIEELRVSLFAHKLGVVGKVSATRLQRRLSELRKAGM